jgi:hypothetical protein
MPVRSRSSVVDREAESWLIGKPWMWSARSHRCSVPGSRRTRRFPNTKPAIVREGGQPARSLDEKAFLGGFVWGSSVAPRLQFLPDFTLLCTGN